VALAQSGADGVDLPNGGLIPAGEASLRLHPTIEPEKPSRVGNDSVARLCQANQERYR
jgi:hypothetical protein